MFTPEAASLDQLTAVAKDLAAITDWSIFWQPVDDTFLGRKYGERIRKATGWTPEYPEYEMPSGTKSVDFELPSGGVVVAHQTSVRLDYPYPLWTLELALDGLTTERRDHARQSASEALAERVEVVSQFWGAPDIGPVGVRQEQAPPPLELMYDGIVAGWHRTGGTIQLDVWEQADFEADPIWLSMHLKVVSGKRTT